jgi:hypothetical protein
VGKFDAEEWIVDIFRRQGRSTEVYN